jgi:alkylation response protein AidB-like acyl-CoA dehydrogenase
METFYSEEERDFRARLADFLKKELAPISEEVERKDEVPFEFFRKLSDHGFMGAMHQKQYGGTGQGIIYDHIVSEEICYHNVAVDIARAQSVMYFGLPISRWGTKEQKERCLPGILKGEKFGAIAITEPRGGSDAAYMETNAKRDGRKFILNGEKTWITNSGFASHFCVFAITDPSVHPKNGMTAFLVDGDNPGFKILRKIETMGVRGGSHCHIRFEDCVVPEKDVIGKVNQGWEVLVDELASERIDIASRGLGCGRRAFEEAVKFSAMREQFRKKIRQFEGISFKIAEMKAMMDASRALIVRAARRYDKGLPAVSEAAIAKLVASESAFRIADMSMQIHGAYGYSKDAVVERIFRDSRVYGFGGGTTEMMKFMIQRDVYKEFGYL